MIYKHLDFDDTSIDLFVYVLKVYYIHCIYGFFFWSLITSCAISLKYLKNLLLIIPSQTKRPNDISEIVSTNIISVTITP